jgi:hypothetical protein
LESILLDAQKSNRIMKALEPVLGVRHAHLLEVLFTERTSRGVVVGTSVIDYRQSLQEVCRRRQATPPREELLQAMAMAADGLDFLSQRYRCSHKNVRPDNMLLLDGALKLTRYGYPNAVDLGGSLAAVGFLAPERLRGDEVTARSDQFALAITYVEFRANSNPLIPNRLEVACGLEEPELSALPEEERAVVARALRARPEERWSDCQEFVSKLDAAFNRGRHRVSLGSKVEQATPAAEQGRSRCCWRLRGRA